MVCRDEKICERAGAGERGYTMLELALVAGLSIIVFAAILTHAFGAISREAAFAETRHLDSRASAVSQLMRADAEQSARSLTRPRPPGVGTESATCFGWPDAYYNVSTPGTVTKTGPTGWNESAYPTRAFGYGTGQLSFTPPPMSGGGLWDAAGHSIYITIGSGDPNIGVWVGVTVNGVTVSDTCCTPPLVGAYLAGDSFTFSIENASSGGQVIRIYRTRGGQQTLWWDGSAYPVLAHPYYGVVYLYNQNASITNFTLRGAPLIDWWTQPEQLALMPTDRGTRIAPVEISPDGQTVLFFGGDADTDAVVTTADWQEIGYGGSLPVKAGLRGTFAPGDYAMLVDFDGGHSVLYQVTSYSTSPSGGSVGVVPATSSAPAWGRFYSLDSDYRANPAGGTFLTFPAGSRLVKLAPPVEWSLSGGALMRHEVGGPAAVADLGVTSFAMRATTNVNTSYASAVGGTLSDDNTYEVALGLDSEGVESASSATDRARGPVSFTLAPPHLNLSYHQQP